MLYYLLISYITIAAATEALRESKSEKFGIVIVLSEFFKIFFETPLPSLPITTAALPEKSHSLISSPSRSVA